MKDLEARKKLLIVESEVYRQTLRLDMQNLRFYEMRARRKWSQYASLKPLLLAGIPLAVAFITGRKQGRGAGRSLLSDVFAGWKMYQHLQPFLGPLLARFTSWRPVQPEVDGKSEP